MLKESNMGMRGNLKDWFLGSAKPQEVAPDYLSLIEDGHPLADIPSEARTTEICLKAVQQDSMALRHVPEPMRTPEVCLAAVEKNVSAAALLNEEELDEDVLCAVLWQAPTAIAEIPEDVLTDKMLHTAFVNDSTGKILELATSSHGDTPRLQQLWQTARETNQAITEKITDDIVSRHQNRQDVMQILPNQSLFDANAMVMSQNFLNFSPREQAPSRRERDC